MHRNHSENRQDGKGGRVTLAVAPVAVNLTVGLLDDDPSVLKATGRLLASVGRKVEAFTDPHSFLRYTAEHHPAVAVLDIRMPIMNGLEVQKRVRSISPSTRIIILTSKDDPSIRAQAMEDGATAFFLKPVDPEELLSCIESTLAGS